MNCKNKIAFAPISALAALFAALWALGCSSDAPETKYQSVVLRGTSNGGGNAIVVNLDFAGYLATKDVVWNSITFKIDKIVVAKKPGCVEKEVLANPGGAVTAEALGAVSRRLKLYLPGDITACSMAVSMQGFQSFKAEGTLSGGGSISIAFAAGDIFVAPKDGAFPFEPKGRYDWFAALDLQKILPDGLIAQLSGGGGGSYGGSGGVLIDDVHNAQHIPFIKARLAESLKFVSDSNKDGRLDESEAKGDDSLVGNGTADEPKQTCASDADCGARAVCSAGVCAAMASDGDFETIFDYEIISERDEGFCQKNDDCPSGMICLDGFCNSAADGDAEIVTEYDNGYCSTDYDCPGGFICNEGSCVYQGGDYDDFLTEFDNGYCQTDRDCPSGMICLDGFCNSAAAGDAEIITEFDNGYCSTDYDCPALMFCYEGYCIPGGETEIYDYDDFTEWDDSGCSSDLDCPTGLKCQNGYCQYSPE